MEKPHKKLVAWQKAIDLTIALYHTTDNFPLDRQLNHIDKLLSGLIKYLKSGKLPTNTSSPFTPYSSPLR
jgi:hypothetical protein